MRAKRSAERGKGPEPIRKLPAALGLGRGIQRETALRHAHQRSNDTQPSRNGSGARKKRALSGQSVTAEISKVPIGNLGAGAPAPAAIHSGAKFGSHGSPAHVQVR